MSSTETYAQLAATLRDLTSRLKTEDKEAIKVAWETLGSVDHRAGLLTSRIPSLTRNEARGLIRMAMQSVSAESEGDYTENLLSMATSLAEQLSSPEFRAKILELAAESKKFDQVTAMASNFFSKGKGA